MNTASSKNNRFISLTAEEGGVLYSFAVFAVLLVSVIFSTVMAMASGGNAEFLKSDIVIIINFALGPIAIFLAIGVLRFRKRRWKLYAIDLTSFSVTPLIATILIWLGLTFGLSEVNNLFVLGLQKLGLSVPAPSLPNKTVGGVIATILFVCVLPAVAEEALFRGLILSGLKGTGTLFACLISGALFSFFHMSPAQTVYQFIVGCVYALVILYGKNIFYTVSMHFANNLYIVLNYYFFNFSFTGALKYIVMAVGILALIVGVIFLIKKCEKPTDSENKQETRVKFTLGALLGIIASVVTWIATLVA